MAMRMHRYLSVVLAFIILSSSIVACGSKEPKADFDMNARVLEVYADRQILRIGEFDAGRKYEVLITDSTQIQEDGKAIRLEDLKPTYQIRIWFNKVSEEAAKYEAVRIDVVDTGQAAPSRR